MIQVHGRRADVRVAELLRDQTDFDALGAEFGCVRVAESVRMDALLDASDACESREHRADVGRLDVAAVAEAEKRRAIVDAESATHFEPRGDEREAAGVHADGA